MRIREGFQFFLAATAAWIGAVPSHAGVIEFTDRAEWEAAVGSFTTIDFTGFPEFTIITTQYQDLGVTFTDGDDFTCRSRVEGSA